MSHSRRTYRFILWRATAACAIAFALAGCGGKDLQYDTDDEVVMYSETNRIRGLDPVKAGDVASSLAIARIYEGLYEYHYLDRPYRITPLLAVDKPEVSENGMVYTIRIRPGIYFQDDPCFVDTGGKGREVVADDFIYAIKRVADVKNASTGWWAFNDRIVGLNAFRDASSDGTPTDYDMEVEGLQALDSHTLQIKLKRPYPQLPWILTMHYAYAVAREAVDFYGEEFVNNPVGTGPYVLENWQRNYRIEFVRNTKWDETGRIETYPAENGLENNKTRLHRDPNKQIPFIDRIVQYVVRDRSTQWLMFLRGQFETSGISRDNFDAVITEDRALTDSLRKKGVELLTAPAMTIFYIGFNMEDNVVGQLDDPDLDLQNRRLRQAMAHAMHTEEWIEFFNHQITRPTGPIPEGMDGYREGGIPYPYDLNRARELMEKAGYPNGIDPETGRRLQLTLEIGAAESPEIRQQVELFSDFMSRIGIVIRPSYNNWPTFLDKIARGQAQMFSLGWVADYPDAENFLQLFYWPNRSPGPNHARYRNREYDRLYEKARVMPISPERSELYQRMSDMIIEDSPWIFSHTPLNYALHHAWLENYALHAFPYGMEKYLNVNVDMRRKWLEQYGR